MGARILAAATNSSMSNENSYDALCSCQDLEGCRCRQNQAWTTLKWKPQNWHHWPLIKKCLIYAGISCLLIWLLVYLILHFYLQSQHEGEEK